jgi:hypothetical protein
MGAIVSSDSDLIKSGALRTTVGTAVGGVIVAIGTAINPVFDAVVGKDAPAWVKAIILVAAVSAWAIVAAADVLARSYVAAHAQEQILPAPAGMNAKFPEMGTERAWQIAALKFVPNKKAPDDVECLIVRTGGKPDWKKATDLTFV